MGKIDLKFLVALFSPIVLVAVIFGGWQIYRGQIATSVLEQAAMIRKSDNVEIEGMLVWQECIRRRAPALSYSLKLMYDYSYKGQSYSENLTAPMLNCSYFDLGISNTTHKRAFPLLILREQPSISFPKSLVNNQSFLSKLEAEKRPDNQIRHAIDMVALAPWLLPLIAGFWWLESRIRRWFYS